MRRSAIDAKCRCAPQPRLEQGHAVLFGECAASCRLSARRGPLHPSILTERVIAKSPPSSARTVPCANEPAMAASANATLGPSAFGGTAGARTAPAADGIRDLAKGHTDDIRLALGVECDVEALDGGHRQAAHHHRKNASRPLRAIVPGKRGDPRQADIGVGTAKREPRLDHRPLAGCAADRGGIGQQLPLIRREQLR